MWRRRTPEIIAGRVNADGTIAAGDGFTVTKGTAGVYTLNFPANFRAIAIPGTLTASFGNIVIRPTDGVVSTGSAAAPPVATDLAFSFAAVGIQQ